MARVIIYDTAIIFNRDPHIFVHFDESFSCVLRFISKKWADFPPLPQISAEYGNIAAHPEACRDIYERYFRMASLAKSSSTARRISCSTSSRWQEISSAPPEMAMAVRMVRTVVRIREPTVPHRPVR